MNAILRRLLVVLSSTVASALPAQSPSTTPSAPLREFRAAWVATVANIDWPSKPGLPTAQQKTEAIAILDRLVALNFNAVVFQVRPQADALYESTLEPWSFFLTGKQGKAPKPAYDPLEFWVAEAHARGLQLHAWFNPYRANHPACKGPFAANSLVEAHRELVVELGKDGYWWMDPALDAVQDHSVAVVLDVVRRYDVDGIHFDDYFYPYASYNDGKDFPDDASWNAYRKGGGALSRGDWRRNAVDRFIERLYREIKAAKPHVEFGISPFGIWRPGHPAGIQGLDQYDALYADARKWLNEGWVDYLTPQLYWPIAQVPQSFPVLLGWWQEQNAKQRNLWPGTSIGRARQPAGVTEILNQVMIVRGMIPGGPGICLFSMKSLMAEDAALATELRKGPFAKQALIPAAPWLDGTAPATPTVERFAARGAPAVRVQTASDDAVWFVVHEGRGDAWSYRIVPATREPIDVGKETERVAVQVVDRSRNVSACATVVLD